jgi:hypothetical protein
MFHLCVLHTHASLQGRVSLLISKFASAVLEPVTALTQAVLPAAFYTTDTCHVVSGQQERNPRCALAYTAHIPARSNICRHRTDCLLCCRCTLVCQTERLRRVSPLMCFKLQHTLSQTYLTC